MNDNPHALDSCHAGDRAGHRAGPERVEALMQCASSSTCGAAVRGPQSRQAADPELRLGTRGSRCGDLTDQPLLRQAVEQKAVMAGMRHWLLSVCGRNRSVDPGFFSPPLALDAGRCQVLFQPVPGTGASHRTLPEKNGCRGYRTGGGISLRWIRATYREVY